MLLLSFSCPENDETQWRDMIEEIFGNIEIDAPVATN